MNLEQQCALQKPFFVTVSSDNEILISDVSGPYAIFSIFVDHALTLNTLNETIKED